MLLKGEVFFAVLKLEAEDECLNQRQFVLYRVN